MPDRPKYTPSDLADAIREKYPGSYDKWSDSDLVAGWIEKYPAYEAQLDTTPSLYQKVKSFLLDPLKHPSEDEVRPLAPPEPGLERPIVEGKSNTTLSQGPDGVVLRQGPVEAFVPPPPVVLKAHAWTPEHDKPEPGPVPIKTVLSQAASAVTPSNLGLAPSKVRDTIADAVVPGAKDPLRVPKDVVAGVAGNNATMGGLIKIAGAEQYGDTVKKYWEDMAKRMTPADANLADEVIMGAGSMLLFYPAGMGAAGATAKMASFAPKLARLSKFAGASAMAIYEAALEAGGVYNDVFDRTGNRLQALVAARNTFLPNLAVLGITDKLAFFSNPGKTMLGTAGRAFASEGVQEGSQQMASNWASKRPMMEGVPTSALVGGIVGGGMGGFHHALGQVRSAGGERVIPNFSPKADDFMRVQWRALDGVVKRGAIKKEEIGDLITNVAKDGVHLRGIIESGMEKGKTIDQITDELEAYIKGIKVTAEAQGIPVGEERELAVAERREYSAEPETKENAPTFYHKIQKTIQEKMPNLASADQVRGIIKDMKEEERKWSGIDEYLDENKGKPIGKSMLLDHLRLNQVELKEVMKGKEDEGIIQEWWNDEGGANESTPWSDLSSKERQDAIARYHDEVGRYEEDSTEFSKWQLPGGENYREMLLTLPERELSAEEIRTRKLPFGMKIIYDDHSDQYLLMDRGQEVGAFNTREEAVADATEGKAIGSSSKNFASSHWDEPNVLAHIRFNDRMADGKKVLFLEEIQSDWHQKGRKEGYQTEKNPRRFDEELKSLYQERKTLVERNGGTDRGPRGWSLGASIDIRAIPAEERQRISDVARTILDIERELRSPRRTSGVPDAPFKKTWHEVALKRMIRYAAENGYDAIAWTTGEQQAERYNLQKHFSSILVERFGNHFTIDGRSPVGERIGLGTVAKDKLAETVGKDLAQKIEDNPEEKQEYRGMDLKVGGEGMNGFYDVMIPSFLNKFGKKFGAQVADINIPPTPRDDMDAGKHYIPKGTTVHSLPITESMRQSVLGEGQSLFEKHKYDTGERRVLREAPVFSTTNAVEIQEDIRPRLQRLWLPFPQSKGAGRIPKPVSNSRENVSRTHQELMEIVLSNPDEFPIVLKSPIVKNGDYGISFDPNNNCLKGREFRVKMYSMQQLIQESLEKSGMSQKEIAKIKTAASKMLLDAGTKQKLTTPCLMCYVLQKSLTSYSSGEPSMADSLYRRGMLASHLQNIRSNGNLLRGYSSGDFMPAQIPSLLALGADLAIAKAGYGGYTKNLHFVEIFADAGFKVNISCGATEKIGFPLDAVEPYRKRYSSVGTIYVSYSHAELLEIANDPRIDLIIPAHLGGGISRAFINKATGLAWEDFAREQSAIVVYKGKEYKIHSAHLDGVPGIEYARKLEKTSCWNRDSKEYLAAIDKASRVIGLKIYPKFKDFVNMPWYSKLIGTGPGEYGQTPGVLPIDMSRVNLTLAKEYFLTPTGMLEDVANRYASMARTIRRVAIRGGVQAIKKMDPATIRERMGYSPKEGSVLDAVDPSKPITPEDIKQEDKIAFGDKSPSSQEIVDGIRSTYGDATRIDRGPLNEFARAGSIAYEGMEFNSVLDLADIAALSRHKDVEHLQYFFCKGNKIVCQVEFTSRHNSSVFVCFGMIKDITNKYKRMRDAGEVDSLKLAHNHPSGDPIPSKADLEATAYIANLVGEVVEHIVVDDTTFSRITTDGKTFARKGFGTYKTPKENFWKEGEPIVNGRGSLFAVAQKSIAEGHSSVLIFGVSARLTSVEALPPGEDLIPHIKRRMKALDADFVAIAHKEGTRLNRNQVRTPGSILDIFTFDDAGNLRRSPYELRKHTPDYVPTKPGAKGAIRVREQVPYSAEEGKYAGSINLDKINAPENIKDLYRQIAKEHDDFSEQRRGKRTWKMTEEASRQVVMEMDRVREMRKGTILNAEEYRYLRKLLPTMLGDLLALQKEIDNGDNSDRNLVLLAKMRAQINILQSRVSGIATEMGRALNSLKMITSEMSKGERFYSEVLKRLGGKEISQDIVDKMSKIDPEKDPIAAYRFVQNLNRPRFFDYVNEIFYSAILSGPPTHIVNTVSNSAMLMTEVAVKMPIRGALSAAESAWTGKPREFYSSEALVPAAVMLRGFQSGIAKAKEIIFQGIDRDSASKFAHEGRSEVFRGVAGAVINSPQRLLAASDAFFKSMAEAVESHSWALREGKNKGLRGDALAEHIAKRMADPPEAMLYSMKKFAANVTFTDEPGSLAKSVMSLRQWTPKLTEKLGFQPLRFIVPFIATPSNILQRGFEYSPAGFLMGAGEEAKERLDIFARAFIGSILMSLLASLALEGRLVGAAPANRNERERFFREGKLPYSVKVGDKYYQFQRLEPFNTPLSMVCAMWDAYQRGGKIPSSEMLMETAATIGNNLVTKTYLSGIAGLIEALVDPNRSGRLLAQRLEKGLVPFSSLLSSVARMQDPVRREAKGFKQTVQSVIPGQTQKLPARTDALGSPIKEEGGAVRRTFPFKWSQESKDPLTREIARLEFNIGFPQKKIGGRELSDDEYRKYIVAAGLESRKWMSRSIASPVWRSMSDEHKRKLLKEAVNDAREFVKLQMFPKDMITKVE